MRGRQQVYLKIWVGGSRGKWVSRGTPDGPWPRVRVPAGSGAERTAEGNGWRLVAPDYGRPAAVAARRVCRVVAVRLYRHDGVCLADGGSRWNSACPADGVCLLAASVRLCLAVSVVYPAQCSSTHSPICATHDQRE